MTEDSGPKVSSHESTVSADASQTRQRKKRKWDQPAESLVSAGVAVPCVIPVGNVGSLVGITLPFVAPQSGTLLTNPLAASCATIPQVFQVPSVQQQTATVVPKLNLTKIQDELIIAREIVINDAESSIRYKLTKRQMQEEIQKCTGAVVITRGKYRPPNAPPDGEKPLYLHISAGAHLKETAERIIAVDHAAAMVEEMLKQGQNTQPASSTSLSAISNGVKVTQAPNTCVFLGFDADPSFNIAARIRGPNDQYINHIINETGATVLLRGRGSRNLESPHSEEGQQPLHLFLSSNSPKSLEDAKRLAENLLDTISVECGASRVSSCKVYRAVPPPQQLGGVHSSENELQVHTSLTSGLALSTVGSTPAPPVTSVTVPGNATAFSQGSVAQTGGLMNLVQTPPMVGYPQSLPTAGTSYSGYGGIFPQATPLQQVALALKQSPSPIISTVSSTTSIARMAPNTSVGSNSVKEKRPPQKRKFQELPVGSKGPTNPHQGSELLKSSEPARGLRVRNISTMPAPKKLIQPSSNGMPPPPPRTMPPPPPPPKFTSSTTTLRAHAGNNILDKTKSDTVPDTLVKLMEYGEEDDDSEETSEESLSSNSIVGAARKPFWAV